MTTLQDIATKLNLSPEVTFAHLASLKAAVYLEMKGMGRRGPSAASIARHHLGLRPRYPIADVLAQLQAIIDKEINNAPANLPG